MDKDKVTQFFITKSTDVMQPLLMLYGIAELLYQILPAELRESIVLSDFGHSYAIELGIEFERLVTSLQNVALPHLVPAMIKPLSKSQREKLEVGFPLENILQRYVPKGYTGEIIHYYPFYQQPEGQNDIWDDPRYPIWAHICSHFVRGNSMAKTYPLAVHIWHAHEKSRGATTHLINLMLNTLMNPGTDLTEIADTWIKEVKPLLNYELEFAKFDWRRSRHKLSMLSLISPATVRGMGSEHISKSFIAVQPQDFWLKIYLTLAGFIKFGFPYKFDHDVLVNIPVFTDYCTYSQLRELASICRQDYDLRKAYGAIKRTGTDFVMLLHLTKYFTFMVSQDTGLNQYKMLSMHYKYVNSHIPGGYQVYRVTSSDSSDNHSVVWTKHLFNQLRRILKVDKIEESQITEQLLRFVQSRSLEDCLEFLSTWYSKSYETYSRASFSLSFIRRLHDVCDNEVNRTMATNYSKIFENTGFLSIARAINHCTTYALYIENETEGTYPFKIRKELRRDLLHVRHDKNAFIDKLGEFIIDYQDESSELRKRGHVRHKVSLADVTNMMSLIDEFGIEIISRLLLVAGYVNHFRVNSNETKQGDEDEL